MTTKLEIARRRLTLIWCPELCAGDPVRAVALALEGGVDIVQVRAKAATSRQLFFISQIVKPIVDAACALLFVNDRLDVALAIGAAGVQLGQTDLAIEDARAASRSALAIGVSAHSVEQAADASARGADLIGIGPMFATATKPLEAAIGPACLNAVERISKCPVFPIGGLTADRIAEIGIARAAVSGAILRSPDPREAARAIRLALERSGHI